jgi:hypothetical protein
MKLVTRAELLSLEAYEQIREPFRRRIIELKRLRRVPIGRSMMALFENHDTVLFQIQEMLRAERISREAAILHELETYNELVPGEDELSATVFIEYVDREERERMLRALAGVESHFFVAGAGLRCFAVGEKRGERGDRTTAVHYLKFPLDARLVQALRAAAPELSIGVDHPVYAAETPLGAAQCGSLREDLE